MTRASLALALLLGMLTLGYGKPADATILASVTGSAGDPITGGNSFTYSGDEGFYTPYWSSDGYIDLKFQTNDDTHWWLLTLGGPIVGNTFTGPLEIGVHYDVNANWQMANYDSANISFAGDHLTYNRVLGGFTLYDLAIENNVLQRLAVQFDFVNAEQTAESVSGYFWMNSDVPLPSASVPEPDTAWLMLGGLAASFGALRRRRRDPVAAAWRQALRSAAASFEKPMNLVVACR